MVISLYAVVCCRLIGSDYNESISVEHLAAVRRISYFELALRRKSYFQFALRRKLHVQIAFRKISLGFFEEKNAISGYFEDKITFLSALKRKSHF